ncbi:MAG TPA: TatD family hydrolase [Chitinophagaceae bacterium]|nr:TatD family hydrolase [Chitinophagaceae bacterium]
MNLVDTHCHIYTAEFDSDRTAMISRAKGEGITKMLMPAIDNATHDQMMGLEKEMPGTCISMMGLHPCSVKENYREELQIAEQWLEKRRFVAVGETGLDFYWDLAYRKEQCEVFQHHIDWALQFDIPVVIHSRNSIDDCIDMIEKNQNGKLKGVFHCFTGTLEQAKKIIELNLYMGIGGVATFKKSGLDSVIEQIDLKNIVLETDAPYLAPMPFRGKRNECAYLKYVVQKLAEIKKIPAEEIAGITTANAENVFQL